MMQKLPDSPLTWEGQWHVKTSGQDEHPPTQQGQDRGQGRLYLNQSKVLSRQRAKKKENKKGGVFSAYKMRCKLTERNSQQVPTSTNFLILYTHLI